MTIHLLFGLALATALPLAVRLAGATGSSRLAGRTVGGAGWLVAVAQVVPAGPIAAGLAVPWLGLSGVVAARAVIALRPGGGRNAAIQAPLAAAMTFLAIGAAWAVTDRAGLQPLGYDATTVLLTAVHFHVAGACLTIAGLLAVARGDRAARLATWVLIAGIPLTAAGFLGLPAIGWAGALAVAIGGLGIGVATVRLATAAPEPPLTRRLLQVGGATLFVTMPLAAAYATGTYFRIAFLDVPAMAAIHGGLNVIGFAIPTMAGWARLAAR